MMSTNTTPTITDCIRRTIESLQHTIDNRYAHIGDVEREVLRQNVDRLQFAFELTQQIEAHHA